MEESTVTNETTTTTTAGNFITRLVSSFGYIYSNNTNIINATTTDNNDTIFATDADDTCENTTTTTLTTIANLTEGGGVLSGTDAILELLERGKKVLNLEPSTSSSVWTSSSSSGDVVGDAGLSDFDEALKLANCRPWNEVYNSIVEDKKFEWKIDFICSEIYYVQGRAYMKLKQYEKSLTSLQSALAILESTVGRYHPLTGFVYLKMGSVYEAMAIDQDGGLTNNGKNNMDWMAKTKYLVALQIERKIYGEDGPWNVPKIVGSLMKDRMGKSEEQVSRKISLAENWLYLELLGDEQAELGETNIARGFYRNGIREERRTEALNNANVALLFRKLILPGEDTFDSFVAVNTADARWKMKSLGGGSYCVSIKLGDAAYLNGNYTGAIGYYKFAAHETDCFQATALLNWMVPVIMFVVLVAGLPALVYRLATVQVDDLVVKFQSQAEFFWNISQWLRKQNEDNHSSNEGYVRGQGGSDGEGQEGGTTIVKFVSSLFRSYIESMKFSEATSPCIPTSDENPQGATIIQQEMTSPVKEISTTEGNNQNDELVHQETDDIVVDDEDTDPGNMLTGSLLSLGAAMARTQKEETPLDGSFQSNQEDLDGIVVQRCSG